MFFFGLIIGGGKSARGAENILPERTLLNVRNSTRENFSDREYFNAVLGGAPGTTLYLTVFDALSVRIFGMEGNSSRIHASHYLVHVSHFCCLQ